MTDLIIKGYEVPLPHNRRCEGCGIIVGPDTPLKVGFEVRDGEVTGFFHSRACYQDTVEKFKEYKKKLGEVEL